MVLVLFVISANLVSGAPAGTQLTYAQFIPLLIMIARPHKYSGPFFFKLYQDLYPALATDDATDHLHHLFTLALLVHIMVSTGEFEG